MKPAVLLIAFLTAMVTSTAIYFVLHLVLPPPPGRCATLLPTTAVPIATDKPLIETPGVVVEVPELLSLEPAQARTILGQKGLLLSIDATTEAEQIPAGRVVSQVPLPGSTLPPQAAVRVVLSSGAPKRQVPNVVGLSRDDAAARIESAGLKLGPVQERPAEKAPGIVLEQKPTAGTNATSGSSVNLVLASAPSLLTVPKILYRHIRVAEKMLTDAGLALGTVERVDSLSYDENYVVAQDPAPNAKVSPGTKVNVRIVRF